MIKIDSLTDVGRKVKANLLHNNFTSENLDVQASRTKDIVGFNDNYNNSGNKSESLSIINDSMNRRSKSNNRNEYIIQKYKYSGKNLNAYLNKDKLASPILPSIEKKEKEYPKESYDGKIILTSNKLKNKQANMI